jgi:hypothetical protein
MDPNTALVALGVCAVAAITGIKVISAAVVKHAEVTRGNSDDRNTVNDARLARLEVAIESIAVEIERISEGQRFTTRLLNSQMERSAPRLERPGKVDTPH